MNSPAGPDHRSMSLPEIVARAEWLVARKQLLAREKALTRAHDALNADRRRLPMVVIDKEYRFDGPAGRVTLAGLFEGRRQLIVKHFMFGPTWEAGCEGCTSAADEVSGGLLEHLAARDTALALVARAPLAKLEQYRAQRGWAFPLYSSYGSDFNYDFHVSFDPSIALVEYNYRTGQYAEEDEGQGLSCFLRDGARVFHTYSAFARGTECENPSYGFLDLTALGRQEDWEEPKDRVTSRHGAAPVFTD